MDWEANLAAMIKCTDEQLRQQFEKFEASDPTAFLFDPGCMDAVRFQPSLRHEQPFQSQHQAAPQPHPTFSFSGSQDPGRFHHQPDSVMPTSSACASTFVGRGGWDRQTGGAKAADTVEAPEFASANNNNTVPVESCFDQEDLLPPVEKRSMKELPPFQSSNQSSHQQRDGFHNISFHPMNSSSYDIAQMMEQIRLSIKLEVDARAAIAERQLSAIMQLCKSTSEELDRLRVEVCANDRQLHTLDQIQQKLRQEVTTQKDIGFHLQSLCGKDESWRMQAENQLLELRQMVATLREQGNGIQVTMQDKLSRPELLVHFNAAIEPIKAQLNANIHHQATQIADVTRTTSSSNLLLDSLTKKVTSQAEELLELKTQIQQLQAGHSKLLVMGTAPAPAPPPQTAAASGPVAPVTCSCWKTEEHQASIKEQVAHQVSQSLASIQSSWTDNMAGSIEKSLQKQLEKQLEFTEKSLRMQLESVSNETTRNLKTAESQIDHKIESIKHHCREEVMEAKLGHLVQRQLQEWKDKSRQDSSQASMNSSTQATTPASCIRCTPRVSQKRRVRPRSPRRQQIDQITMSCGKHHELLREEVILLMKKQAANWNLDVENSQKLLKIQTESRLTQVEDKLHVVEQMLQSHISSSVSSSPSSSNSSATGSGGGEHTWAPYAVMAFEQIKRLLEQISISQQAMVSLSPRPHLNLTLPTMMAPPPREEKPSTASTTLASSVPSEIPEIPAKPSAVSLPVVPTPASALTSTLEPTKVAGPMTAAEPLSTAAAKTTAGSEPEKTVLSESSSSNENNSGSTQSTATSTTKVTNSSGGADSSTAKAMEGPKAAPAPQSPLASGQELNAEPKSIQPSSQPALPVPPSTSSTPAPPLSSGSSVTAPGKDCSVTADAAKSLLPPQVHPPTMKPTASIRPPNYPPPPISIVAATTKTSVADPPEQSSQQRPQQTARTDAIKLPGPPVPATTPTSVDKVQSALESTAKRAMIEAEMAKQRVESRRKAELEMRQASAGSTTPANTTPTPTSESGPPLECAKSASQLRSEPDLPPKRPPSFPPPPSTPPPAHLLAAASPRPDARPPSAFAEIPNALLPSNAVASPPAASPSVTTSNNRPSLMQHLFGSQAKAAMAAAEQSKEVANLRADAPVSLRSTSSQAIGSSAPSISAPTSTSSSVPPPTTTTTPATTSTSDQKRQCTHCLLEFDPIELSSHEVLCEKMLLKQCPHCLRRQKANELQDHINTCDCRLVSCPNDCGGKFLQRGLQKHLLTRCPKRPTPSGSTSTSASTALEQHPQTADQSSSVSKAPQVASSSTDKQECKFCDEEFPAKDIESHEQSCDWKPKRCQFCNMVIISRDLARHEANCRQSSKACSYCNEMMPLTALASHASRCVKRPIKCIRCCNLFPADTIVEHSTNCKFIPGSAIKPSVSGGGTASTVSSSSVSASMMLAGSAPPPPPPPPTTASMSTPVSRASSFTAPAVDPARRSQVLSQLIGGTTAAVAASNAQRAGSRVPDHNEHEEDGDEHGEQGEEDEEEEEEEDGEDGEEDQLTLAQVVAEWNVENVCLWLHEDVGVGEVVHRFQDKQCNGTMLLELTESDLINEYGIKNRLHRERILCAIDAIKTSDEVDDDEDGDEEEEQDDDEDEEEERVKAAPQAPTVSRLTIRTVPISTPPQMVRQGPMPNARADSLQPVNGMLRRINSALGNDPSNRRSSDSK